MTYSILRVFVRGEKSPGAPIVCDRPQDEAAKLKEWRDKDQVTKIEVHRHVLDVLVERTVKEVPYTPTHPESEESK